MRASPIKFLALALVAASVVNLLVDGLEMLNAAAHLPAQAWLLLLVMALICTFFGYSYWFLVIRESEVNLVAMTIFLQPVCGAMVAKLWLGESLHWGQLWGSVII
jgi:drug/metabolite transporter (DMT)-like permease